MLLIRIDRNRVEFKESYPISAQDFKTSIDRNRVEFKVRSERTRRQDFPV